MLTSASAIRPDRRHRSTAAIVLILILSAAAGFAAQATATEHSARLAVWKVANKKGTATGTAFAIAKRHFLTNAHVIEDFVNHDSNHIVLVQQGAAAELTVNYRYVAVSLTYDLAAFTTRDEVSHFLHLASPSTHIHGRRHRVFGYPEAHFAVAEQAEDTIDEDALSYRVRMDRRIASGFGPYPLSRPWGDEERAPRVRVDAPVSACRTHGRSIQRGCVFPLGCGDTGRPSARDALARECGSQGRRGRSKAACGDEVARGRFIAEARRRLQFVWDYFQRVWPKELRHVYEGFQDAFHAAALRIGEIIGRERENRQVWLTGHSLGGALAVLLAATLLESGIPVMGLYTFGAPRVGDSKFASLLDDGLAGAAHWRVANEGDLVPHVPAQMFFSHAGNRMLLMKDAPRNDSESTWKGFIRETWSWMGELAEDARDLFNIGDPHRLDSEGGYLHRLVADVNGEDR